jgi:hypothetical protein
MTKKEAESKIEYLETSEEIKAKGLRRIKRRHFTNSKITLKDCQVITEVKIAADLLDYLETESKVRNEDSINSLLNNILRQVIKKRKFSEELLNDSVFVSRLREKLAA